MVEKDNEVTEAKKKVSMTKNDSPDTVDVTKAIFDVALSFPGEEREYARTVADRLSLRLGRNRVFYDDFYKSQLARPNLDTLLQDIYRNRSSLVVAFLCEAYSQKEWCGIEFRAIREIIKERDDTKVMFVKHDNCKVEGVFSTDGYINANAHTPVEVAGLILERVGLNETDRTHAESQTASSLNTVNRDQAIKMSPTDIMIMVDGEIGSERTIDMAQLAERLGVDVEDVRNALNGLQSRGDLTIDSIGDRFAQVGRIIRFVR